MLYERLYVWRGGALHEFGAEQKAVSPAAGPGVYRKLDFELHARGPALCRLRRGGEPAFQPRGPGGHAPAGGTVSGRGNPLPRLCGGGHPRGHCRV